MCISTEILYKPCMIASQLPNQCAVRITNLLTT
nr:MAG TPA: hypothetical protein [Caudoviricetes sp.]